jgi:hypothetical protein
MKLTDEQRNTLAHWVQEGQSLSDIQRKLDQELGLKLTFMETRFLIDDFNLELVEQKKPAEKAPDAPDAPAQPADAELVDSGAGGVSVSLDRITQPGSVVSGSVTFSDGKTSTWALDQMGRLLLKAAQEGYKPSREDLESFQLELSRQLERQGY